METLSGREYNNVIVEKTTYLHGAYMKYFQCTFVFRGCFDLELCHKLAT